MLKTKQPWNQDLCAVDPESASLTDDTVAILHALVAKRLFVTKRARPENLAAIAFLTTRVSKPTKNDRNKLVRMMKSDINERQRFNSGHGVYHSDQVAPG